MRNVKLGSMKRRSVIAALSGALLMGFGANAMADSTDDIVNALIAKGVLTEEEGALLMKGRAGEKEAAAQKKESAITASFKDGIVFESGDKKTKISINGRIQEDYRSFNNQVTNKQADTWDTRRAYLGAKGTFYDTYDFEVTFNGAESKGSSNLYQAWLNVRYWDEAQFKFGQYKQPMGMEELGSSRFINFTERSFLSQLVPGVDQGGQVHGVFKGATYALGMFNGVNVNGGQNVDDTAIHNDGKSWTGRATANIAEFMDYKDAVFHLGGSYSDSWGNSNTDAVATRTEARGTDLLKTKALNTGYGIQRTGLEAAVAYGPVKFQSEWLKAKFKADGNDPFVAGGTTGDKDIKSWNVQLNWLVTGETYADTYKQGLFGNRIKPKADFDPRAGKYGWGAWDIGVRYSKLDGTDFKEDDLADVYDGTNPTENAKFNQADAWTYGVKWIPGPNTRFMLDYIDTNMDCASGFTCTQDDEKAFNFRAQFDF